MNAELIRNYCLKKPGSEETFPFDEETLVFKVMGKIYALLPLEKHGRINLKCDPTYAIELREKYSEIEPGYHMSKKHWNTIDLNGGLTDKMILAFIDHSYDLVVKGLKKADRLALEGL